MTGLTYEQGHPGFAVSEFQSPLHLMCCTYQGREILVDFLPWNQEVRHVPLHSHKEMLQVMIYVLIQVEDIPPILVDELRHQGHEARLVWTMY